MAENHPVGFQWAMEARERGAKIIHVDPRFTRTSAMADIWVPLRAGSDIVFLGGLIHYVLERGKEFREYVVNYTNAATLLRGDFRDTEDLDGLFSGWDAENKKYDPASWGYRRSDRAGRNAGEGGTGEGARATPTDPTLQDPRCVFRVLKRHFARYTPEMVEQACGVSRPAFLKAAEAFVSASGPEKTGAICYALGWTQHSNGVQISGRRRSCSCCWATSADPEAGCWQCAGTPRSRAQPTFPLFSICCPATCPCRRSRRTRES
jgi:formate dehydrogenase major subunit